MAERDRAASPGASGCITIFRSRLRPEHAERYRPMAERMHGLAVEMPGFLSIKTFAAEDGERVSIVEFESLETSEAWRDHPEHQEAQRKGRERFFSAYRIQVCESLRDYSFLAEAAAPPDTPKR